jgi:hypothetical protein
MHIKDPRLERNKAYPLLEVMVITLLAVMASAEGWEDIEKYGKAKEGGLKKFLPLEHGIPIRCVPAGLYPAEAGSRLIVLHGMGTGNKTGH